jgi:hypothetical protein
VKICNFAYALAAFFKIKEISGFRHGEIETLALPGCYAA